MMNIKSIIKNKNIWLFIYVMRLIGLNDLLTQKSIIEGSDLYTLLQETMIFGPAPKMERSIKNFLIRTPVWAISILILFVCVIFTNKDFFESNKLTKFSKYIMVPFSLVFTIYIGYATFDLINTQNEIIKAQYHDNCISDISLETLSNIKNDKENSIIYIEKDGCTYCHELSNKVDNIAYANGIIIYRYDAIYDYETKKEKVDGVLNELGVCQVPCVVVIKDKKVYKTYHYEDINNGIFYEDIEKSIENGTVF